LIKKYGYPKQRLRFEHPVQFGRQTKAADIVIFDKDRPTVEYIIVELKKPKLKDGKDSSNRIVMPPAPLSVYGLMADRFPTTTAKTRIILKILPTFPIMTRPLLISSRNALRLKT